MQNDITDAVQWAVSEGIVDKARVAISGISFGGYCTLAGATFTPGRLCSYTIEIPEERVALTLFLDWKIVPSLFEKAV